MDEVVFLFAQVGIQRIQKNRISPGPGRGLRIQRDKIHAGNRRPEARGNQIHLTPTPRQRGGNVSRIPLRSPALRVGIEYHKPDVHGP